MVCVTHGNLNTSLYISDVLGSRFSLSLENIVYFSPTGANSDTWLRSVMAALSYNDITYSSDIMKKQQFSSDKLNEKKN